MAYFWINLLTDKCSKMSIMITQAPGSEFIGPSLAVLRGAKELLTHISFDFLLCLDVKFNK